MTSQDWTQPGVRTPGDASALRLPAREALPVSVGTLKAPSPSGEGQASLPDLQPTCQRVLIRGIVRGTSAVSQQSWLFKQQLTDRPDRQP